MKAQTEKEVLSNQVATLRSQVQSFERDATAHQQKSRDGELKAAKLDKDHGAACKLLEGEKKKSRDLNAALAKLNSEHVKVGEKEANVVVVVGIVGRFFLQGFKIFIYN